MKLLRRICAALSAATFAAALMLTTRTPSQAATTGWAVAYTHHYGPAANYSYYSAIAVPAASNTWAFGSTNGAGEPAPGRPVAEHWNGSTWSSSSLPSGLTSTIAAVSAVSASSVWAVAQVGGDILRWNGSKWSVAHDVPGTDLLFTGITAVSDTDVWAFGSSSIGPGLGTWHYNGHTWTQQTGSAAGLVLASAVSANDIWAVGSTAQGPSGDMLAHYDGTTWQAVTATALNGLEFSDILAVSATDVWAVAGNGSGGAAQLVHFNGSTWTSIKAPYSGIILGFAAPDGLGGFWLDATRSASTTWVLHYSASGQWSRTALTSGSLGPLALVPGTTSLFGVGSAPTATPASTARVWAYSQAG